MQHRLRKQYPLVRRAYSANKWANYRRRWSAWFIRDTEPKTTKFYAHVCSLAGPLLFTGGLV